MFNTRSEFTIPKQHYITFSNRSSTSHAPLGFMVPDGTDKSAQKRKATADRWADDTIDPVTTPNKLMTGFKILNSQRRYYNNNVVFRILDPRGFELEINAENLERLISTSTIENGEILSPCMWARKRTANYLISEDDELLVEAKDNTERFETFVPFNEVNVGDTVLLQSGIECVYMGRLHPVITSSDIGRDSNTMYTSRMKLITSKNKKFFFRVDNCSDKRLEKSIINLTNPKVSKIISKNEITLDQAEKEINDCVFMKYYRFLDGHGNHEYYLSGVVANFKAKPEINFKLEKIDNFSTWSKKFPTNTTPIIVAKSATHTYILWDANRNSQGLDFYLEADLSRFLDTGVIHFNGRMSHYGLSRNQPLTVQNFDWYLPQIEMVNKKTGNAITFNLRN